MSVSINSDYSNVYGWVSLNTTTNNTQQESSNSQSSFGDYLQLATNTQGSSIGNYDNSTTDKTSFTTDQKTAYLETMLKQIQSTDSQSSSNLPSSLQSAFYIISDLLSNFDANSSSEEEISNLFTSVTSTLEEAKPTKEEMQANGMTPPPLPQISSIEDTTLETSANLSVSQMKELISNLISTLNSEDESTNSISNILTNQLSEVDESTTTDSDIQNLFASLISNLISTLHFDDEDDSNSSINNSLTSQLSQYNESTTDSEVQALFDSSIKQLEETQQSAQTADDSESDLTEAFPTSIQMTGTSLPPFNWKPSTTTTTSITQSNPYASSVQL